MNDIDEILDMVWETAIDANRSSSISNDYVAEKSACFKDAHEQIKEIFLENKNV